jgi:hypothetical protein
VSSAVAALSASSSARASRQQQACTGVVAAGSAAVGAAGGRREQRWSSAACSNQWAQVARSGGGQGELVQTSASRGGLKFQRRSSTLEQGSAQGEIGGKVKSPPPPTRRMGPALREEEAARWGHKRGLRFNWRLSGSRALPVIGEKGFQKLIKCFPFHAE